MPADLGRVTGSPKRELNSHDEWSALREIVVGSAENYLGHDRELSFELFFHEHLYRSDWAYPRLRREAAGEPATRRLPVSDRYAAELNEDVEAFAETLLDLGVNVLRPIPLPVEAGTIAGFGWAAVPVPPLNVRDVSLVLGDEIIETAPAIRSRYLETRLLSPIFKAYFEGGARWTTMPRPVLTDRSFDLSYALDAQTSLGGPTEPLADPMPSAFDVGFEMMLDGAQCLRLGRDLIVNVANENHAAGYRWLQRHLGDRYRLHQVYRLSDNHIDSMLLALRPGVFLARHSGVKEMLPEPFSKWKFIVPPEPELDTFPTYDDGDLLLTSPYIDLNVLSISPQEVIVNEACHGLRQVLETNGFTVIPVRHRHRRLFGGGFHCFTLDTVRESPLEDYT